jgi:hypothetical protein
MKIALVVYCRPYRFYEVYCEVEPKRQALEKANAELKAARDKLDSVNKQVAVCQRNRSMINIVHAHVCSH